jgi:hypothetical protein
VPEKRWFDSMASPPHVPPGVATTSNLVAGTARDSPSRTDRHSSERFPEGRHYSCRCSCGGSVVLVDEAAESVAAVDFASA